MAWPWVRGDHYGKALRLWVLELAREFLPAQWNICPGKLSSGLKTKGFGKAIQMQASAQRRCWAEDPFKGDFGLGPFSISFFFFGRLPTPR